MAWRNMLNKNLYKHEYKCLEMPDRMQTKIKRHVVLGFTEDLLLSPGLQACDKTWRGNDFIALHSGERSSTSLVTPGMDPALYLTLINRAGGLYGRILTEVVSTDRTQ